MAFFTKEYTLTLEDIYARRIAVVKHKGEHRDTLSTDKNIYRKGLPRQSNGTTKELCYNYTLPCKFTDTNFSELQKIPTCNRWEREFRTSPEYLGPNRNLMKLYLYRVAHALNISTDQLFNSVAKVMKWQS